MVHLEQLGAAAALPQGRRHLLARCRHQLHQAASPTGDWAWGRKRSRGGRLPSARCWAPAGLAVALEGAAIGVESAVPARPRPAPGWPHLSPCGTSPPLRGQLRQLLVAVLSSLACSR